MSIIGPFSYFRASRRLPAHKAKGFIITARYLKYAAIAVILVLVVARFVNLDADPPLFFLGHGQAQLTDPYNLTFFARNATLFDRANPFDFHRWDIFKYSLVSLVSYIVFGIAGVSRVTANLSALILQLSGIFFFLLAIYRKDRFWPTLLAAFLLLVNSTLFFYGRLPFLENGLICLSALVFLVFIRWHDRLWGQILIGVLLALAGFTGKLFGLILAGPILLTLIYIYRGQFLKPSLWVGLGFVAASGLYLLIFWSGDLSLLLAYYSEQSVGMYGSPPGFTSPFNFFKMLVTYGGESGLNQYAPFLFGIGFISFVAAIVTIDWKSEDRQASIPTVFSVFWVACGVLGLMPFYYRPLRYAIFLYLPEAALAAYLLSNIRIPKLKLKRLTSWSLVTPVVVVIFIAVWHAAIQIATMLGPRGGKFMAGVKAIPLNAFIAFALAVVALYWMRSGRRFFPRRIAAWVLGILIAASIVVQIPRDYTGLFKSGKQLKQYNREFAEIVDGNAVFTGPYTAAMSIDNNLKGIIYMFGLSNRQEDLFQRFPITHVAADHSNWEQAMKDFPFLKNSTKITQVIVRDVLIGLFRVPGAKVPLTDFERGSLAFQANDADSAIFYYGRFLKDHPDHMLAATHLALSYQLAGRSIEAMPVVKDLEKRHADNYYAQMFISTYYEGLYKGGGDASYLQLAKDHKAIALRLDPALPNK